MRFQFLLLLFFVRFSMISCGTLHQHHVYYVNKSELPADSQRKCQESGEYGDTVILQLSNQHPTEMYLDYELGFSLVGILGIPFLPVRLSNSTDKILLRIDYVGLTFDPKKIKIRLDKGEWITGEPYGSLGIKYNLGSKVSPTQVDVALESIKAAKQQTSLQIISFYRKGDWHYVPIIVPHTEWPYSYLPCGKTKTESGKS